MRLAAPTTESPSSPLLWFGVLGAPLGWTVQFAAGYWLAEARCSPGGGELLGLGPAAWMVPLTALATACALAAWAAALRLHRRTAGSSDYGAPPGGRNRFLAVIGIAIAPLFLAMIALTALGVFAHNPPCTQS